MALPVEKSRCTFEEYLRLEESSADRHEFHDGELFAMAGGSYAHSKITLNLGGELRAKLRGTPCEPLDSNLRIRVANRPTYVYADVFVICGGPQFDPIDKKQTTILNPRLVIEVLSDSTELYDRGAKFDLYRQIPSVEEYVLISQHQPQVESYFHQADGAWTFNAWKGLDSGLILRSLDLVLPLAQIYERVAFVGKEMPA